MPFNTTFRGVQIQADAEIDTLSENIMVEDLGISGLQLAGFTGPGNTQFSTLQIGAPRPNHMIRFSATVNASSATTTEPSGNKLMAGFIQVILATDREAQYQATARPGVNLCKISRPDVPGNGLLDSASPPWFGRSEVGLVQGDVRVEAGDNPFWTIPYKFALQEQGEIMLNSVTMNDRFHIFLVVHDGSAFHPLARAEWESLIIFTATKGGPRGNFTERKVRVNRKWSSDCEGLITEGRTANTVLVDQFRMN